MVTLYFYWEDYAPVTRFWPFVPRIGDTIVMPELGGNLNRLRVYDVVCEGYDEPSVSIFLHDARREQSDGEHLADEDGEVPL